MQIPKIALEGDKIHTIRSILKIYSIVIFNEDITDREAEVLSEYLTYGVTDKAFKAIRLNYNIEDNNRRQIDLRLQKKGLLISKPYRQGRELHKELEFVRTKFVEGNERFLLLEIWK